MYSVSDETRKPIFEGVQGENESREIQFDISPWIEELGEGVCTATAKRPTDATPYPVTVTRSGNIVTWKPKTADVAIEGTGAFQLSFSIDSVVAKTRIWNTKVAPSLVGAGDPPDPIPDYIDEMRQVAADALQSAQDAEAWAVGQRGGVDVPSTDPTYENNSKYWAEQSAENQYGAFIVKSASGDIASFSDGGDDIPMKSVNVTITPKQSGSGDPSPSNVRPISGTSTANVFVTGANVWDEEWESGDINIANGEKRANGNRIRSKNFIPVVPNTAYYFKSASAGGSFVACFYDENKNWVSSSEGIGWDDLPSTKILTTPSWCRYLMFYQNGTTYNHDISINYPSTDTEYHPYAGHTTPVPLGQTVYGGTVDVTTGILTIDSAIITYDGSNDENWIIQTNKGSHLLLRIDLGHSWSRWAETVSDRLVSTFVYYTTNTGYNLADNSNTLYVQMPTDLVGSTVDSFKAYIAQNPITIVYPVTTPTTVQLTPTQVASLLGTNNVWADCGSVAVEYRADPTLAYNELANVIVSLGGNL